jgi:hypothetical protein
MVTGAAVVVAAGLLFSAMYAASRPFRRRSLRRPLVAGPAVGVAKACPGSNVRSHRWRERPAAHRSNTQTASYGRSLNTRVPDGVHRRGTSWDKLNEQRNRFTAAVRGGAA